MRDLTNYDYEALVATISEELANKPGWGEGYESSIGQTLIQLMADVTDNLHFMLERRAQEAFISTARLHTSVMAHASELGYRPRRKVSSTGTVRLTLVDDDDNVITAQDRIDISAGTAMTGVEEEFVVMDDVYVKAGESYVDIPVKEGVRIINEYNFNEEPYRSDPMITIDPFVDVEEYSLKVGDQFGKFKDITSSDVVAKNITSLSYAMPSDAIYDIKFSVDGMRIIFGDGEFGKKPRGRVTVEWVRSKGDEVGIIFTGREFFFEDEFLFDNAAVSPRNAYRYKIENITPIRGGADEETTQEIAANASIFTRTANRAVTNQDYEFIALRSGLGDIVDVHSYGEQEIDSLIYKMNNVYLSYTTSDNLPLNIEQKKQLREYMDRFKNATTHLIIAEAVKLNAVLDVEFKRNPQLPIADAHLYDVINDFIKEFFELKRGSISKEIQHSELVRFLQNRTYTFNGVEYETTDFVKVDMYAQYEITPLETVYDVLVYIDEAYPLIQGHQWIIVLDGENYIVPVEENDTISNLVEKMRDEIFERSHYLLAIEGDNDEILRIKSPFIDARFTMNLDTGDLAPWVSSDTIYQLPDPRESIFSDKDGIYAGSATLINSDEEVLFRDDGNGWMEPEAGVDMQRFEIDYKNSTLLSPPFDPDETYYVRYQQNRWQNLVANDNTAIVLSPFASAFSDAPLYSKIEIL